MVLTIAALALAGSLGSAALRADGLPSVEEKQIEALIAAVERMADAAFIRNGRSYRAAAAAEFLRRKWRQRQAQVRSAEDFIEKVASFSSTTGQPYGIRFGDGREIACSTFLANELGNLRKQKQ